MLPEAPTSSSPDSPQELDLLCESCGYSLLGITNATCPECGKTFNPDELPLARIPWLHRKKIGKLRAYWRTVWMILFTPRKFVRELARPVRISPLDASRFRKLTIRLAGFGGCCSAIVGFIVSIYVLNPFAPLLVDPTPLILLGGGLVVGYLALTMFLRLATDVPVFIWQNLPGMRTFDLAPVHHYACAPLALFPLVALFVLPILWVQSNPLAAGELLGILAWISGAVIALWLIILWTIPVIMMRAAIHASPARMLLLAAYLPFHYIAMVLVTAVIFCAVGAGMITIVSELLRRLGISF